MNIKEHPIKGSVWLTYHHFHLCFDSTFNFWWQFEIPDGCDHGI